MVKIEKTKPIKTESAPNTKTESNGNNKYQKLTGNKRKFDETTNSKEVKVTTDAKKIKNDIIDANDKKAVLSDKSNVNKSSNGNGFKSDNKASFSKNKSFDKNMPRYDANKKTYDANRKPYDANKKPYDANRKPYGANKKPYDANRKPYDANKKPYDSNNNKPYEKPLVEKTKKQLIIERKQKKMGDNYDVSINMKKIWETLRMAETTDDTKKKLCTTLYDHAKGRISQLAFAHDTCRVIECLCQYGNEKHRTGVFDELKDDLVELSKSKYARFMIKKMLLYCNKDQKEHIIKSFMGHVTKLIKHSFACQSIETVFNEHASVAQRNQMLMEFYDPTFAVFNDQSYKSLADVLVAQPFSKEKILATLKALLTTCLNKTLLMFSIVHRVFLEYFTNCEPKEKLEMIDSLSEHLIHLVHTKDGANVAMQCIWYGAAKERKKIIKAFKSFFVKMANEEHGHLVILAIFDSVDDTKFVSKAVLEELFRSMKDLFANDYGRKVITYLISPRDTKFFLKDYTKRLQIGDTSETSKKDAELKRQELFDYSKKFLKEYLNKELTSVFYNGESGVLLAPLVEKLEGQGDEIIQKIADLILEKRYELADSLKSSEDKKEHCIENATCHFITKQLLKLGKAREEKSLLTLDTALLSHKNNMFIRSWIDCNRGCYTIVNVIETATDLNKQKLKIIMESMEKQLVKMEKSSGAKLLIEKLKDI